MSIQRRQGQAKGPGVRCRTPSGTKPPKRSGRRQPSAAASNASVSSGETGRADPGLNICDNHLERHLAIAHPAMLTSTNTKGWMRKSSIKNARAHAPLGGQLDLLASQEIAS